MADTTRAGVAVKTAVVPPLYLTGHRRARSISVAALPRAQDPTLVLSQQQGAPRSGQRQTCQDTAGKARLGNWPRLEEIELTTKCKVCP